MKKGFTLIELIILILIIAIIAVVAINKLMDLQKTAIENQERAIIGALQTAIYAKYTENVVKNPYPGFTLWPCNVNDNLTPFDLLANPPQYTSSTAYTGQDKWFVRDLGSTGSIGGHIWRIECPHYWPLSTRRGFSYAYYSGDGGSYKAGSFYQRDYIQH